MGKGIHAAVMTVLVIFGVLALGAGIGLGYIFGSGVLR